MQFNQAERYIYFIAIMQNNNVTPSIPALIFDCLDLVFFHTRSSVNAKVNESSLKRDTVCVEVVNYMLSTHILVKNDSSVISLIWHDKEQ